MGGNQLVEEERGSALYLAEEARGGAQHGGDEVGRKPARRVRVLIDVEEEGEGRERARFVLGRRVPSFTFL